jgi:hypothetical protein
MAYPSREARLGRRIGRRELPLDPLGSYRRWVRACLSLGVVSAAALVAGLSCQTVDPGPNYVLPTIQFSANYFYCVVEPQLIMGGLTGTPCGDNGTHGCHYSDKVPEMTLLPLPKPVTCSGTGTSAVHRPDPSRHVHSGRHQPRSGLVSDELGLHERAHLSLADADDIGAPRHGIQVD